mgnify:CR=1 FL=1
MSEDEGEIRWTIERILQEELMVNTRTGGIDGKGKAVDRIYEEVCNDSNT